MTRTALRVFPVLLLILAAGCAGRGPQSAPQAPDAPAVTLRFVESVPEETVLGLADMPQAPDVWPQVLGDAKSSIEVASFYFSRKGDGEDAGGPDEVEDRLLESLSALEAAATRGIRLRTLADSKFNKTYPEVPAWLAALPGAEGRILDAAGHWDGVLHAKYFLVDDRILYIGSQNWDWRALSQIHELGVLADHPWLGGQLKAVFDMDWALAGVPAPDQAAPADPAAYPKQKPLADLPTADLLTADGDTVRALLAASPARALPNGVPWDLPLLVEMIDGAEQSVRLQLLSYDVSGRDRHFFPDLDNALRGAAARGVQVQIILSNWSKSKYKLPWVKSLAAVRNLDVKFSNIPEHSQGFIPFARVEHPKYLTVDGAVSWVGTSNWSRNYFHGSRNVGLILQGAGGAEPLQRFFDQSWNGPYTELVDPGADYQPPRRN